MLGEFLASNKDFCLSEFRNVKTSLICFNAIVGPNGSGKSNVIDATLFAFGYRATKIRCKKISELIHNCADHPDIQSCTVSVRFAEIIDKAGDDYETVQGSEFVIARTVSKDNSSYYQVNKERVQFKEVAKKLRSHGIDLDHNRFLILQGEVEDIAMMKNKGQSEHETGMLEYLEDIIGTSRFKVPLVQLEERVELLTDQRYEKLNRVKLVRSDLKELKKTMKDAVEFLQLENTIVLNKNIIFQWRICEADEKIKEIDEQKSEVAAVQKHLGEELDNIQKDKQQWEANFQEACKICETLRKRSDQMKEASDVASNRDLQFQTEMIEINKTRKTTKELLVEERNNLAEYQKTPDENESKIKECIAKEREMAATKEKLEDEKIKLLDSLREATVELQEQKEHLQTELVELNKEVDETKSAFTLAEAELNIYVSNEDREKKKLEEIQIVHTNITENINVRSKELNDLKKKIPTSKQTLKEAIDKLKYVKNEEAKLIDQIRAMRTSIADVKSSMQATMSRGRVLDSLMQQKREGTCPGLFGRLGDLGAINQKYDVAISTACGPLDNFVVDNVSTAQWCIEFLKKTGIGRGTFIALEKQEHLRDRANSSIVTPENIPRLFDLIKITDERIKPAFYYALRDTLVANDLDQATRIAYGMQRYRVVTLSGQLIETTGTMSGGGKTVQSGRMGQSVAVSTTDPKDVQRMEERLQIMEERIRTLRQEQEDCESIINTLEPEVKKMEIDIHKFTIELESCKQQEPLIAEQLETQKTKSKSTKADEGTVKKLIHAVNKKKDLYSKAADAAQEVQVQVDRLTNAIKEKTIGKMKIMDKKLRDVQNTIDECKSEVIRRNVATRTAQRNEKKSTEKIANLEQDVTDMENKLRHMKAQREANENDRKQLLETVESIAGELTDAQQQCSDIKKTVGELAKEENKIKSDKIEVDEKCKTYNASINEQKGEIHGYRSKLTQLKLQEIPDHPPKELKTFSPEELKEKDVGNLQRQLTYKENQIKSAKPNLNAITEYRKKQMVYTERSKELDELSQRRTKVKEALDNARHKRKEEFAVGYNIIRLKLKQMYQTITSGGDADFEYVDAFDPFTEGIQFNVRPPKKYWKNISTLSGGEKTLCSLALVFALHYYKPSPFYVMDEIDAALDHRNVSLIGNYINERTKNAQFIIITLRQEMYDLADCLIGITKPYNCTQAISFNPKLAKRTDNIEHTPAVQNIFSTESDEDDCNDEDNCSDEDDSSDCEENHSVPGCSGTVRINAAVVVDTRDSDLSSEY